MESILLGEGLSILMKVICIVWLMSVFICVVMFVIIVILDGLWVLWVVKIRFICYCVGC